MPERQSKREMTEHIHRRARELASTGQFYDYQGVEFHLRFTENLPKAPAELNNHIVRAELNLLCAPG